MVFLSLPLFAVVAVFVLPGATWKILAGIAAAALTVGAGRNRTASSTTTLPTALIIIRWTRGFAGSGV